MQITSGNSDFAVVPRYQKGKTINYKNLKISAFSSFLHHFQK